MAELSRCSTCKRAIRWTAMIGSGTMMPLDPEPADDGTVVIVPSGHDAVGKTIGDPDLLATLRDWGVPTWRTHFATCPDRDQHRRS